jgi:hypothetical protein
MADLIFSTLQSGLCFYVARTWFRGDIKMVEYKWRSRVTTFDFAASTGSQAVILVLMVHGFVASGFPLYHVIAFRIWRLPC